MPTPTKTRLTTAKRAPVAPVQKTVQRAPSARKSPSGKATTAPSFAHHTQPKPQRKTTIAKPPSGTDYLKKILTAKVYEVAHESALDVAKVLGRRLHNQVLLKRED